MSACPVLGYSRYSTGQKYQKRHVSAAKRIFFLEEINDGEQITGYKIYGGGFGHGAGLSQNGADTLAEKGYDYREILTYFFEGINIENVNTLE